MEAVALLLEDLTFLVQEIMQHVYVTQLERKEGNMSPVGEVTCGL